MASATPEKKMASFKNRKASVMTLRVESLAQVREKVQKKTFTRWANMSLSKKDQIRDLFEDLKSGTTLIKLINILSESSLRPERGRMEIHNRSNIGRALEALSKVDPQHGISISAIYEGIPKLTLALCWHLILRYSHLQERDMMGVSAEVHCKNWCGENAAGYVGLENIEKDFLGTWITGLVLPAIISRNKPELIDYADIYHNKTPEQRFAIAFGLVEKNYSVPKLLDVEDICESESLTSIFSMDMNKQHIDDQSVVTYLMLLNKVLSDNVPDIPPAIVKLKQQLTHEYQLLEEDLDDESSTEEEEEDLMVEETDLTPVEDSDLPQIMAAREQSLSTTPEYNSREEDKDSGLELEDYSPVNNSEKPIPRAEQAVRDQDAVSQRDSSITLDSEAEYLSAASSPVLGSRRFNGDTDNSETTSPTSEEMIPDTMETAETMRLPIAELEATLNYITNIPENIPVTVSNLEELKLLLKERGEECAALQTQINHQLNWKQEWDKRADLHKLLSQTGRFDDALRGAASELDNFVNMLDEFEKAVARSQEFADSAEEYLAEEDIPSTATETNNTLTEQKDLLNTLEEEQRNLEYSYRSLSRAIPKIIPLSIYEQQRSVTAVQNSLSDIEGVISGSVETLSFLSSRLPSLEQKLQDADEILTKTEDEIDSMDSGSINPEDLQLQMDRANTHLATVDNLFTAIESFSSEFNLQPLKVEWEELNLRADRSRNKILEMVETEEAVSEEVVAVSDWAETLETFLQRRMKAIESRKQLREVQGKWKEVAEDLRTKCEEIEVLLQSDYSTQDHRVMSPLDKDTLISLRNQLASLQTPLQSRRELLQEAYSNWGNVESQMKSLSLNMLNLEFAPSGARYEMPGGEWSVRPMLEYVDRLTESEKELEEQAQQLQSLVQNISDLPTAILDTSTIVKERENLLNKHTVLCKRASNKRVKFQRTCLKLEPVLPFLRPVYLNKIKWLYKKPLPDIDSKRDSSSSQIVAVLKNPKMLKTVRYSQYWHAVRTVAPEKIPLMLLTWFAYALGPWGMGCSTDKPMMISLYTPDLRI
ncbi:alpha-actinin-like isoform X4 [Bolinopsis microptera]|uniref:alpha-actinin-like isoform X4 n=1 Tax=Bolinopsis microptera TaxID=2820187 RepID=UPI003079921B